MMISTLAARPSTNDLWACAAAKLSSEDRRNINFSCPDKLNILSDLLTFTEASRQECIDKRWRYTRKNGETIVFMDLFGKVVKCVDLFKQVGDAALQYDPVHTALPWAGVRFLLQIAVNDFTKFAFLVEGAASIAEIICRCAIFEHVCLQSTSTATDELKRALVQLYAAIMIYLSKAKSYFDQNSAKRIIKSGLLAKSDLDSYFGAIAIAQETVDRCLALVGVQDQIERHAELKRLLEHIDSPLKRLTEDFGSVKDDLAHANTRVDELVSLYNDESLQKVYDWLSPLAGEFENKQQDTFDLKGRQDGLGNWLLKTTEFKKWMSGTGEVLWCCGEPGIGKTVLASFVIDTLQKDRENPDIGITYMYCDYKAVSKQTPVNLIANLLRQLVLQKPILQVELTVLHKDHTRNKTRPTLSEYTKLLQAAVARFSKVRIVIDALDECPEADQARQSLLGEIGKLKHVSVLITSRNIPFENELRSAIRLDVRADDSDIIKYIEDRISRSNQIKTFADKDTTLCEVIKNTILEKAKGMLLLAFLYLEPLMTKNDRRSLKIALNSLPEGLDATYEAAMERINAQSSDDFELARKVLYWISYAFRPLAVREIQDALAVWPGDHNLDEDGYPEEKRLLSVCAGLVTIQRESQTIILVHHTAQEYFKRQGVKHFPQAHTEIATLCLTYLSFDTFKEGPCASDEELEKRLQKYPFLGYAAEYWGNHFSQDLAESAKDLVLGFLEEDSKLSCSIQIIHQRIQQPPGEQNQRHKRFKDGHHSLHAVHTLWMAAYFGLGDIISVILEKKVNVLTKTGYGETVLHPAARCGNDAVIPLLLEAGADINAANESRNTPLLIATGRRARPFVIQVLLENGADVTAKDDRGQTALHLAAEDGDGVVAKLLLEKGADVAVTDEVEMTALHLAAENGHETVVQLLLDKGADVAAEDESGITALHLAAENGHETVVQLLLEKGADVAAEDESGITALHLAAENGHEEIVQLLLGQNSIDLESKDKDGWTPLSYAIYRGHEMLIQLLLEKGANAKAKSNTGTTMLICAAGGGNKAVFQLLLEKGLDVGARTDNGMTALHTAAFKGHEAVVRLLIEKGADIAATMNNGATALHVAVVGGQKAVIRLLLDNWVDIRTKDNSGQMVLHYAAEMGNRAIVELLLESGADVRERNGDGVTALDLATKEGHEAVVQLLVEKGADVAGK